MYKRCIVRVAVVHDWLYVLGGAERVLREILRIYPDADVYTMFDVLKPEERAWIGYKQSHTSFLQRVPKIAKLHRALLPLMPIAVEQFDLSQYDLVISSSYAVAKGVITGPDQLHVAYVHSPMRYAWDLQHQYLKHDNSLFGMKRFLTRLLLHPIRQWDASSGQRPDAVVANSAYIARRIGKTWGRKDAHVVYPPVDLNFDAPDVPRAEHFLCASRLVAYKNTQPVVEAFALLPDLKLTVVGRGPELEKLKKLATPNVTFAGWVSDDDMRKLMTTARALVFAAEEDFGIVPVEAQAQGTPVLALGRGGARETVVPGRTGKFFAEPTPSAIAATVNAFITEEANYTRGACVAQAAGFSPDRFRFELEAIINGEWERLQRDITGREAGGREGKRPPASLLHSYQRAAE
jgi:glycosyltransferase involved in cell wall biosynthesis